MLKLIVFFGCLVVIAVGHSEKRYLRFDEEFDVSSDEFSSDLIDKNTKYDLLVVSQTWPQTACWDINRKWTNNTKNCSPCNMPESKIDWTLHGLWPSSSKGAHPFNCNTVKFNLKLLNKALLSQMVKKWLSFNLYSGNEAFWKHEWDKHGTCAMNLPSTNTLPKYFSKSIQLLDQYNIGKILAEANILPGKKYDIADVVLVIKKALGVSVEIGCATHSMSKEFYLNQIGVCLNTSFQLINCPKRTSNCKNQVWYPQPQPKCTRV